MLNKDNDFSTDCAIDAMKKFNGVRRPGARARRRDDFLEMLGSLAHKLSQPLTSLQGTVEVALMGEMDVKEYRRILEISFEETKRVEETAEVLGISKATVKRDWSMAKAWLHRELTGDR